MHATNIGRYFGTWSAGIAAWAMAYNEIIEPE